MYLCSCNSKIISTHLSIFPSSASFLPLFLFNWLKNSILVYSIFTGLMSQKPQCSTNHNSWNWSSPRIWARLRMTIKSQYVHFTSIQLFVLCVNSYFIIQRKPGFFFFFFLTGFTALSSMTSSCIRFVAKDRISSF